MELCVKSRRDSSYLYLNLPIQIIKSRILSRYLYPNLPIGRIESRKDSRYLNLNLPIVCIEWTFFSASFSMKSFSTGDGKASFVASQIMDVLASSNSVLPTSPETSIHRVNPNPTLSYPPALKHQYTELTLTLIQLCLTHQSWNNNTQS